MVTVTSWTAGLIIERVLILINRFFLCTSMIICNDICAYLFGFFFGKTPLIKLSPKKTVEGYLGGGAATIAYAIMVSIFLNASQSPYRSHTCTALPETLHSLIYVYCTDRYPMWWLTTTTSSAPLNTVYAGMSWPRAVVLEIQCSYWPNTDSPNLYNLLVAW